MKLFAIFFFVILASSLGFGQNKSTDKEILNVYNVKFYDSTKTWKDAQKVSVNELLREPNKYKGKLISVYGYASLNLDDSKVYGSEESFKNQNNKDAILYYQHKEDTNIIIKKFKQGYATITGLFYPTENSEFDGMVYRICRIDIIK